MLVTAIRRSTDIERHAYTPHFVFKLHGHVRYGYTEIKGCT